MIARLIFCIAAALLAQGCIVLTADVARYQPDPMAAQFVQIASASGKTVTLVDGRKIELPGLDLGGMSAEQVHTLEQWLHDMPKGCDGLLVYKLPDGRSRLETVVQYGSRIGFESLAVPIFPHYVDVYPVHEDLGMRVIDDGLAKAAPQDLGALAAPAHHLNGAPYGPPGATLAQLYRLAEQNAQAKREGIWRSPQESSSWPRNWVT